MRGMAKMFNGCTVLSSLDVSNFNTSNVNNFMNTFTNCKALTSLDLSSFNTASVARMSGMFSGDTNLTTIYVSNSWTNATVTNASYKTGAFTGCTSLVGGAGTTYNASYVTSDYAIIDTAGG